jgi:hypothetical protein
MSLCVMLTLVWSFTIIILWLEGLKGLISFRKGSSMLCNIVNCEILYNSPSPGGRELERGRGFLYEIMRLTILP